MISRRFDPESLLVLCTERFWPAHGGVERYTEEIAKSFQERCSVLVLTAIRSNCSFKTTLQMGRGPIYECLIDPLKIEILTAGLNRFDRFIYRGIAMIEDLAHSLAIENYYETRAVAMSATASLLSRALKDVISERKPTNTVVHAMGPWEMSLVGDALFPYAAKIATPFIHPGHWGEDEFSRRWYQSRDSIIALGYEDEKVCFENGIAAGRMDRIPIIGPRIRKTKEQSSGRRNVVFLGVARKYKGLEIFVEMARILRGQENLKFVWAGSIPPESAVTPSVAEEAGVKVLGSITESQKEELLESALCLCLPSMTEITPYSILEAWASGAAVVTTDNPHMREFVGEGGLLVERTPQAFADAVQLLANSPGLVRQQVQEGRELLRGRHGRAVITSRLDGLYADALFSKIK